MSHLGQNSPPSAQLQFSMIPVRIETQPPGPDSRWRLARRQERMALGLKSLSAVQFETAHSGGLSTYSLGARSPQEPKWAPPSPSSEPMPGMGSQSGASLSGPVSNGQTVNVSREAERFAHEHMLWGSLVVMKTLVSRGGAPVVAVDVDLVSDPDVKGAPVICFALRSNASLPEVLDYDEHLRGLVCDQISAGDRLYFAIRFDLE